MKKQHALQIVPIALASLLLVTACDAKPKAEKIVVEEDIVLNDGSVITEWIVDEIVPIPARKAPGVGGVRPSMYHIWVPGEWMRNGDAWEWVSGSWKRPPLKNASWMSGHWRLEADNWHWTPGHWVVSRRPHLVAEKIIAPTLLTETKPEKPSEHNHWIAGYWDWDGSWYWIPGYWTSKPNPDAEWAPGHWDEFGVDGHYRWIGGHWHVKN